MLALKHAILQIITVFIFLTLTSVSAAQEVSLSEPVDNWSSILATVEVSDEYVVQKKDTLYDISSLFFGDAHYWPKIWSLNPNITNPHLISPGQIIFFKPGTLSSPPVFGLKSQQEEEDFEPILSETKPVIPEKKEKQRVRELPSSFPQIYTFKGLEKEVNLLNNMGKERRLVETQKTSIALTSEIKSNEINSLGKLFSVENGSSFAREGDQVVVQTNNPVSQGEIFSFYESEKIKKSKYKTKDMKSTKGMYIIHWLGEFKIKETVDASKNLYLANVEKSYQGIPLGSPINGARIQIFTYDNLDSEATEREDLKLLGAGGEMGRILIGEGELVYLNRGSSSGVSSGEIYSVGTSVQDFFNFSERQGVPGQAALLKILSVDDVYSTGVIYKMSQIVSSDAESRM